MKAPNTMPDIRVPIEYLTDPTLCSKNILGEYQLKHLDKATALDKQIRELMRLYIAEMAAAGFALFLRENRQKLLDLCASQSVITD